jgi:hypothetical protein
MKDRRIHGAVTFWNSQDQKSSVDYFLLCPRLMSTATKLTVQGPSPIEGMDHCPMRVTANLGVAPAAAGPAHAIALRTLASYAVNDEHLDLLVHMVHASAAELQQLSTSKPRRRLRLCQLSCSAGEQRRPSSSGCKGASIWRIRPSLQQPYAL